MSRSTLGHRRKLVLVSPIIIIAIARITANAGKHWLGTNAWIPTILVFWLMFGLMISWGSQRETTCRWVQPSQGYWGWALLAVLVGLIPLGIFLLNWQLFPSVWFVLAWILFALVNPVLEEGYWRGLLLDTTSNWPGWLGVLYSSFFFAINHILTLGVFSIANHHPATFVSTFIMGLAWSVVYRRTQSLRWVIFGHFVTDLLNLSVLGYSGPFRTAIPAHSGQGFRLIPDNDSGPFRTSFPVYSGHSHQLI